MLAPMRILVIEDNSDIAANIGDYLEEKGLDRRVVLGVNPFEPPGRVCLIPFEGVAE